MTNELAVIDTGLHLILNSVETPHQKGMIKRWIDEVKKQSSRLERDRKILEAVRDGYDTIKEIVHQTGMPQSTVYERIQILLKKNKLKRSKTVNYNSEYNRGILHRYEIV